MSKTIHYLDLPKLISLSDITPWLEVLGSLGFKARPDTGTKLEYKNSGLVLYSTNSSIRIQAITNSYNIGSYISSALSTTSSYRFAYVKFGNSGIAFTIVNASERADMLKTAITECGDNKWFCYSTGGIWKTGTGNAEYSILTSGFKVTPDAMLLVPIKYYGDIIPDLCMGIYGPSSSGNMFICHVDAKAYLVSYIDSAPFAIDIDAIWDDGDY